MSRIYIIIFTLIAVFSIHPETHATGYNYLPNDVYIKQQEEKSAMEYRLRKLESQSLSSPSISINLIDQRIEELRQEWDAEKNYSTGRLAQLGSLSTWGGSSEVLQKIDTKYSSQISNLESQKAQYQQQVLSQSDIDKQIAELKQQLKDIDSYYDKQLEDLRKSNEVKKQAIINDTREIKLPSAQVVFADMDSKTDSYEMINIYSEMKKVHPDLYNGVLSLATQKYFNGKTDPATMFAYLDSLPTSERNKVYGKLTFYNPEFKKQVDVLVKAKYPNGKTDSVGQKQTFATETKVKNTKTRVQAKELKDSLLLKTQPEIKTEINQKVSTTTKTIQNKPQEKTVFRKIISFFAKMF